MSDFSDAWLALRVPADTAARADELVQGLAGLAPATDGLLQVLDLGCGTGANLRHLAPLLAAVGHRRQQWTCVDHAPALLARLPAVTGEWAGAAGLACRETDDGLQLAAGGWEAAVATRRLDLAGDFRVLPVPADGLVTASALLDLVSASWLDAALLARCRAGGCALLFTLSYDGRCTVSPAHGEDARVVDLVNRHQRTDKGFGPALGPAAAERAAARCRALGWRVEMAPSDWVLGTEAPDLQHALLAGWRDAASAMASSGAGLPASRLDAWLTARCGWVAAGRSWLRVGHQDLLALP